MKVDTYTKGILTIIALCLVIIVAKEINLIPQAKADVNDGLEYVTLPLNADGTLNVHVKSMEMDRMDVSIVDINTYDELKVEVADINTSDMLKVDLADVTTSDEIDINIDELGGYSVSSGGPLKVKVEN